MNVDDVSQASKPGEAPDAQAPVQADSLFGNGPAAVSVQQPAAGSFDEPVIVPTTDGFGVSAAPAQATQQVQQPVQTAAQPQAQPVQAVTQPQAQPVQEPQPQIDHVQEIMQIVQDAAQPLPVQEAVQPQAQPVQEPQPQVDHVQEIMQIVQDAAQPLPVQEAVQPQAQPVQEPQPQVDHVQEIMQIVQDAAQPLPVQETAQPQVQPSQEAQPQIDHVQEIMQIVQDAAQAQPVQEAQPVTQVQPAAGAEFFFQAQPEQQQQDVQPVPVPEQPQAAPAVQEVQAQPVQAVAAAAAVQSAPAAGLDDQADHADVPEFDSKPFESFYTAPPSSAVMEDLDEMPKADAGFNRSYTQNRELSWLTFNERVLDQGADESVPLLDRLNFISIFWSNLQEFFMVRVGSLTDLAFIEPPIIDKKSGMTPNEQIKAINERCRELYPIQESYYEHVRGSLAKHGVRHLRPDDLSEEQRNYLSGFVTYNIQPFLSPQIINPRHPFPHLENGKLYILVRLDDEAGAEEHKKDKKGKKGKKDKKQKKAKGGAEGVVLGLIPLPHQCERIIKLPGRGFQFILLEHAIEMFAADIFSMYKIKHTNVVCVTRNADLDASQGGDEQDEDYREHMRRLLKKRARLAPVRLECERPLSPVMEKLMLKRLGLKRSQVYDTTVPLDLSFTWGLGSHLSDSKRAKLTCEPFTPAWPVAFDRKRRIIDQVGDHDILLSYPYESMDPFVQLLREAANDPSVISIKITLYRLASQSQLAEALIAAADNGKEVTALFELRARFDEFNNIEWSQRFEQAGCNVLYGFRDYKVHSKICCITRQGVNGVQHITQLGTGNYNEKTAKLYTDFSYITTDEAFGRDAMEFFRNMQLENISDNYEVLRVAPLQIKPMIIENLDRQIQLARQGKPCGAFMKANSITDEDVIAKIAEASQAGVGITLFIRGICCLIPEIKGATENVRVVSIVGRLLEHSRIYCFGTPDDCVMYLSSADLMTRNLNKRVEIAWPILDADIRWRILDYIDICLHDTAKLRELRPNATYTPLGAFCDLDEEGNAQPPFDSQAALIQHAANAEKEAGEDDVRRSNVTRLSETVSSIEDIYSIPALGYEPAPEPEPEPEPAPEPEPVAAAEPEPEPEQATPSTADLLFGANPVVTPAAQPNVEKGQSLFHISDTPSEGAATDESLSSMTIADLLGNGIDEPAAAVATAATPDKPEGQPVSETPLTEMSLADLMGADTVVNVPVQSQVQPAVTAVPADQAAPASAQAPDAVQAQQQVQYAGVQTQAEPVQDAGIDPNVAAAARKDQQTAEVQQSAPAAQAQPSAQESKGQNEEDAVKSFFDEESRTFEVPPEKTGGFFSRLRGK